MKLLQVLALLCLVTSLGYSCKIRLTVFLEDLFRNEDDRERQSSETAVLDRRVVEPLVISGAFLTSLVANVVRILNNNQSALELEIQGTCTVAPNLL